MKNIYYIQFTNDKKYWGKELHFKFEKAGFIIKSGDPIVMSFRLNLIRE